MRFGRIGEPCLDIAATRSSGGLPSRRQRARNFRCVEPGSSRLGLVAWRKQRRALRRCLERLGNHDRDRLVCVTHQVVLKDVEPEHEGRRLSIRILRERRPVRWRHHLDDTGMRHCSGHIEKGDAAARDAADRKHGVEELGGMVVRGKACAAGDLEDAVAARERLADIRAVPDMRRGASGAASGGMMRSVS